MYDKAVDTYPSAIKFAPEYYKTKKMRHRAVHRCFLYFFLFLTNIKLKKHAA